MQHGKRIHIYEIRKQHFMSHHDAFHVVVAHEVLFPYLVYVFATKGVFSPQISPRGYAWF